MERFLDPSSISVMRRLKKAEMKTRITEERAERLLRELVSTPSPPRREDQVGKVIAEELEASGLRVERVRVLGGRGLNLLCYIGGEGLMINGHMDTVPPIIWMKPTNLW